MAEVSEMLARRKSAERIGLSERVKVSSLLATDAVHAAADPGVQNCRDPDDDKHLALALAAGAGATVSSDEDLLVMDPWRSIRIVRARDVPTMLGEGGS